MEALWKSILDALTPLVIPDWGALVNLIPVGVAILGVAWFALTLRRFATAGPSVRPLLGALGSAALLGGLVIKGWVLVLAVVFLAWTLVGWLVDATAEYRMTERADQTGHLENIPTRKSPTRTLQVFAVLFV